MSSGINSLVGLETLAKRTENKVLANEMNRIVESVKKGSNIADAMLDKKSKFPRLLGAMVATGEEIGKEFGIPIVNKRISVTPIALIGGSACKTPDDFVKIAQTLDRAAKTVGVNFIGGYTALVSIKMTQADKNLILSIPKALATTEYICSSVNVGSTKTGHDIDAILLMG